MRLVASAMAVVGRMGKYTQSLGGWVPGLDGMVVEEVGERLKNVSLVSRLNVCLKIKMLASLKEHCS